MLAITKHIRSKIDFATNVLEIIFDILGLSIEVSEISLVVLKLNPKSVKMMK